MRAVYIGGQCLLPDRLHQRISGTVFLRNFFQQRSFPFAALTYAADEDNREPRLITRPEE